MATTNKKLSRAKAEAAEHAISHLLEGTGHDMRLCPSDRAHLADIRDFLHMLAVRLREDERK